MNFTDIFKVVSGLGDGKDPNVLWKLIKPFLPILLPLILGQVAAKLREKDANNTGADDAFAGILEASTPTVTALFTGEVQSGTATLKTMRELERIAHNYRVQVQDPTLEISLTSSEDV